MTAIFSAASQQSAISVRDINFRNAAVDKQLDDRGLVSVNVKEDGNCFFRALSVCLHGHENKLAELCNSIAKHLSNHSNDIFADNCNSQANRKVLHGLAASTYIIMVLGLENMLSRRQLIF